MYHPFPEPRRPGVKQSHEMDRSQHAGVGVGVREKCRCGLDDIHHCTLIVAQPIGRKLSLNVVQETKLKKKDINGAFLLTLCVK